MRHSLDTTLGTLLLHIHILHFPCCLLAESITLHPAPGKALRGGFAAFTTGSLLQSMIELSMRHQGAFYHFSSWTGNISISAIASWVHMAPKLTRGSLCGHPTASIERSIIKVKVTCRQGCLPWTRDFACGLLQCHYLPVSYTHLTLPTKRIV